MISTYSGHVRIGCNPRGVLGRLLGAAGAVARDGRRVAGGQGGDGECLSHGGAGAGVAGAGVAGDGGVAVLLPAAPDTAVGEVAD